MRKTVCYLNYLHKTVKWNDIIIDERINVRYNKRKRGDIMTAITVTKARENIYKLIKDVNASSTPITITNNKGENAVLIGEDDWKAIEETLYLSSIPGMAESIINGGNTDISECLDESEVELSLIHI